MNLASRERSSLRRSIPLEGADDRPDRLRLRNAAGYVHLAKSSDAVAIEVNREQTPATQVIDLSMLGKAGENVPAQRAA